MWQARGSQCRSWLVKGWPSLSPAVLRSLFGHSDSTCPTHSIPGISSPTPCFFLPVYHGSSQKPDTEGTQGWLQSCPVCPWWVHFQGGAAWWWWEDPREDKHSPPSAGGGGLEKGDGGSFASHSFSFLQKVTKFAVVVHLFKAGSIYPRLTTNPQSSFLIPAWEINLYHHARLLGYIFGARTNLNGESDSMATGVRILCLTAWASDATKTFL